MLDVSSDGQPITPEVSLERGLFGIKSETSDLSIALAGKDNGADISQAIIDLGKELRALSGKLSVRSVYAEGRRPDSSILPNGNVNVSDPSRILHHLGDEERVVLGGVAGAPRREISSVDVGR
jgi:hypothetical protein